ncbi:sulfotransferase family protein [Roseovarius indicus]|nr:sulfotransferase [Roseovarius indicus]
MKFCVVGTGRCGTRLLRSMLNTHPELFMFNETHWLVNLHDAFGTAEVPMEEMLDIVLRTRFVDGARITELDADAFRAEHAGAGAMMPSAFAYAAGRFLAAREGKTTWADKTPDYGYFAATLQLYWPDCKIIHLIRGGANVVRSMAGHPGYKALVALGHQNWCPQSLDYPGFEGDASREQTADLVELWCRRLMRIRNESERLRPGSYIEIRHEDVLASPAATLERVARFTGLRFEADWMLAATGEIDRRKADKLRVDDVLRHFGSKYLGLMRSLGYSTDVPDVS